MFINEMFVAPGVRAPCESGMALPSQTQIPEDKEDGGGRVLLQGQSVPQAA